MSDPSNPRHVATGIEATVESARTIIGSLGEVDVLVDEDELADAVREARELSDNHVQPRTWTKGDTAALRLRKPDW